MDCLNYTIDKCVEAFSTMREGMPPFSVLQPHQTHTDNVVVVERRDMTREDLLGVDALVTNLPDFGIAVRTADCVPILMYDGRNGVIAAVHSGWKGTVAKISQKTIRVMEERFGTETVDVKAVIGPSIGPDSFQVGSEVADKFCEAGFPMEEILTDRGPKEEGTMNGGLHIDLWKANQFLLEEMGVSAPVAEQPVQKDGGRGPHGEMIVSVHPPEGRKDGAAALQHLRSDAMPGPQQEEHGPVRKMAADLIECRRRSAFPVFSI